ncbi:MAG: glycosyltransferase [Pseudobdellovibrionaceae bacterium]
MHPQLRVAQVMAGAAEGGAETAFEDMCIACHEAGVPQIVVIRSNSPRRLKRLQDAGLSVHILPFGGPLDIYTPFALRRIFAQFRPRIVQTWMSRAAQKTPASSDHSYLKVSRLGGYYKLKYFASTDYFTTITPDIRDYLIREGVPVDKVRHINNFADVDRLQHPVSRAALDTPDDAFVVLTLARYHSSKALDVLIRAATDLPRVHVWLAGSGPLERELKELAHTLGLEKRIHFLGWRSDRADLMQESDVCALPSRYEPFGTTFVQAWAQGIPLVCARADGPRQFVRHGEDGLLFDIDDVAGLRACLVRLMDEPDVAERLVAAGKARYEGEFMQAKTVQSYLDFYAAILERENMLHERLATTDVSKRTAQI